MGPVHPVTFKDFERRLQNGVAHRETCAEPSRRTWKDARMRRRHRVNGINESGGNGPLTSCEEVDGLQPAEWRLAPVRRRLRRDEGAVKRRDFGAEFVQSRSSARRRQDGL